MTKAKDFLTPATSDYAVEHIMVCSLVGYQTS